MSLADLSNLVIVANHINEIVNDKSISTKDDVRVLNTIRTRLNKKFLEELKTLDIDSLFTKSIFGNVDSGVIALSTTHELTSDNFHVNSKYISGIYEESNVEKVLEESEDESQPVEAAQTTALEVIKAEPIVEDELNISDKIKAQKDKLKKEGRSNKRISQDAK